MTSPALLTEVENVLSRERILRSARMSAQAVSTFLSDFRAAGEVAGPTRTVARVERDPADNRVLEAAIAGAADYIVSGDQDLTDLVEFEAIPILTPAQFVAVLQQHQVPDAEA